jgi:hypothetical protein
VRRRDFEIVRIKNHAAVAPSAPANVSGLIDFHHEFLSILNYNFMSNRILFLAANSPRFYEAPSLKMGGKQTFVTTRPFAKPAHYYVTLLPSLHPQTLLLSFLAFFCKFPLSNPEVSLPAVHSYYKFYYTIPS